MRDLRAIIRFVIGLTIGVLGFGSFSGGLNVFADSSVRSQAESVDTTQGVPAALQPVKITEHLGEKIDLDYYVLTNSSGRTGKLSDFVHHGKPIVVTPIYYGCPSLCKWSLKGLIKTLKSKELENWTPGDQFEILTFSINPNETPDLAASHKAANLEFYGRPNAESGWHFFTGNEAQVSGLAKALGFGYQLDPQTQEYAHAAVAMVLTPEGRISRYLYGIEFRPQDFRIALVEASNGKIGNVVDQLILFCFRYDPHTRKYSVYSTRLMEAGCLMTTLVFGGYLMFFWRRQRKGA